MEWKGVISAITTPFKPDYSVDHAFLADHAAWQLDNGVDGIVALGSLGEAATLSFDCLLYTSPSPRDRQKSRMPSSA